MFCRKRHGCAFEPLEQRCLLDATPFARISHTGTLLISGSTGADTIAVSQAGAQIVAMLNTAQLSFPPDHAHRIYITAQAGDDAVRNDTNRRSTIHGGDGNDTLLGGPNDDWIVGDSGDDAINTGGGARNFAFGDDGTDTLDYSDRLEPFTFAIGNDTDDLNPGIVASTGLGSEIDATGDMFEVVKGTNYDDDFDPVSTSENRDIKSVTLLGGRGNDTFQIAGSVGMWTMIGGPGNDYFAGGGSETADGVAAPTLIGGHGNDYFIYTNEQSVIAGGPGRDTVDLVSTEHTSGNPLTVIDLRKIGMENAINVGFWPDQTIIGDDGANYITVEAGGNGVTLLGNGGNDTLVGGAGNDYLSSGTGDDLIEGGSGADTIFSGDGNDLLAGNSGNDKIHGGLGNDTLIGQTGRDRLYGDDGDDLLLALDHQRDTVYGGNGADSAYVDDTSKVKDLWGEIEKLL